MTIKELTNKVTEIEASVNEDMSKEELYDQLVIAYHHLKDIIVLQQGNIPIKEDNALEVPLRDAQDALSKLRSDYAILETNNDILVAENADLKTSNNDLLIKNNKLQETNKSCQALLDQINTIAIGAIKDIKQD